MADETNAERQPVEESTNLQPSRHGKRIVVALIILVIVGVLAAGYWYYFLRGWVSTDDAFVDCDQVTISSKILDRLAQLTVDEGDTVKQGQLLVLLDSTDLKAQEAQAQASLDYIRQNVPVAQINLERVQEDYKRAEVQYKGDVIPREEWDHARQAVQLAQAQYNASASQVAAALSQLGVIQTELQNTRIVAQGTGVVAKKWVVVGDIVQPGQPIYTIYDLSDVWITANFEETKLASIRVGEPVEVTVDAFPDRTFSGRVELIGAAAASEFSLIPPNNASGNFTKVTQRVPVKISVSSSPPDNSHDSRVLLPGMSVLVRLREKD